MSAHAWNLLLCWWRWPLAMWTRGERQCGGCGQPGHIAANCPRAPWRLP